MGGYEELLLGGGGYINSQSETHQSLSAAAYAVSIK